MTIEPVPFSSHLDELRRRLIWSALGVLVVFALVFALFADDIVRYILDIAVVTRTVDGEPVRQRIQFSVISPLETFGTTMRVSFYAALVFAYPWFMFQAYLFVAPGLYRHERRFFQIAIPAIFLLFFAGAAFGRYVLLPISIPFLLEFNVENFEVEQNYTLGQYLGLVFAMTWGLGFVFQIPLLVAPLIRFGLLTPEFFKSKRRYTVFVAILLGALLTPTGSPIDMILVGVPIFFLVEGGVWAGSIWKRAALRSAQKEALKAAERGETIDPEKLAGGLAGDLQQRLDEMASGGARKLAQELFSGLREGATDARSIFDDDFGDDDKPPAEVKLKPRKPKAEPAPMAKADQIHTPAVPAKTEPDAGAAAESAAEPGQEEWPDRPWDESVTEEQARYIDDRISQKLNRLMDQELRPWMERIEHELRKRNGEDG